MIYEGTIQYIAIDENGNDKSTKENYIIENAELFAQVENKLYEEFEGYTDIDVVAVKRSRIKEIINTRQSEDDLIWLCEIEDVFLTEDGEEKPLRYKILGYSKDFNSAKTLFGEYLKQGYSMNIISIKKTKFEDVLK